LQGAQSGPHRGAARARTAALLDDNPARDRRNTKGLRNLDPLHGKTVRLIIRNDEHAGSITGWGFSF
jgi:hypothetical protein